MDAARELFIQNGYKKTTIRQIVEKSGVLIGSIYHVFTSKEEIFGRLILDAFNTGDEYAMSLSEHEVNAVERYAVSCILELYAVDMNERVAELYYEGYSSQTILDSLVRHAARRSQGLFHQYNPSFTFADYYLRTLAIKGAMRNFIGSRLEKIPLPANDLIDIFLDLSLSLLCVPAEEIAKTKKYWRSHEPMLRQAARVLIEKAVS